MWVPYNPNPAARRTGDCVIRALSKVLIQSWDETYWALCLAGADVCDWGNNDFAWASYLRKRGYRQHLVDDFGDRAYTVSDFCGDHPKGRYVLSIGGSSGGHVVAVVDGDYFDMWDSGQEIPVYFWQCPDCERGASK